MKAAHPERIVPEETPSGPLASHLIRYQFALEYCRGRRVVDAACGVGYGSALLGSVASEVLGVDLSDDALVYARLHYVGPRVRFLKMDLEQLVLPNGPVDVICSFETLEHLAAPEAFVARAAAGLRPDGLLLISTPHVAATNYRPANPHHRVEFSPDDLRGLLERYFGQVTVLGQRRRQSALHRQMLRADVLRLRMRVPSWLRSRLSRATGTAAWADATMADFVIDRVLDGASELFAICARPLP